MNEETPKECKDCYKPWLRGCKIPENELDNVQVECEYKGI